MDKIKLQRNMDGRYATLPSAREAPPPELDPCDDDDEEEEDNDEYVIHGM